LFEKSPFGQITQLRVTKIEDEEALGAKSFTALADFLKFVTKIIHFKHITAKIQPKNMKLVHY